MNGDGMNASRTTRRYRGRGLHGEVVEVLGRRILSGELAEGATLDVPGLEQELDVSLSVLREALRVLKAKGLVDARPRRGTFVQARTEWLLLDPDVVRWQFAGRDDTRFLDDLAEVRAIIEPSAARLAALRRTDEDLATLQAAIDRMAAAAHGDGDPIAADVTFHRALLTATHNELLLRTEVVLQTGLTARDRLVHGAVPDDDPTPAHAAVLTAIRDRDPEAAAAAVTALLAKSLADVEKAQAAEQS